jgi:ParB-like chromosome segregation protein Spo0J
LAGSPYGTPQRRLGHWKRQMAAKKQQRKRTFARNDVRLPRDTGETIEDLETRLKDEGAPKPDAKVDSVVLLPRADIRVAERAFQWRLPERNMVPRHDHIFAMAKAVRDQTKLPPITVFPVGKTHYVIDGHHRLAAYDTAGWKAAIPAKVFFGTLREAERVALRSNSRDKLPISQRDKFNAAWRLVKQEYEGDSIRTIAQDANVSTSTVDNMRATLRTLKNMGMEADDIRDMTSWNMARGMAQGRDPEWRELEDWREAEAQKLVDAIINAKLGTRLTKNPDITAIALAKLNDGLPQALMAEWIEPEDDALAPFDPHDAEGDLTF